MNTTHFDERYSASIDPFSGEPKDNSLRLGRLRRYLPEAMEDLTARQRQVVHLHFFENLSVSEIARQLEVNPSSVSRCLSRAQLRLHRVLRFTL